MFRKLTLSITLTVFAFGLSNVSFATTYIWTGAVNTYNLLAGDSLYIPSGTFTGTISSFPQGAKITVDGAAIFQPSSFPNTNGNSAQGTIYNYGTFSFNQSLITNTGFTLNNYGFVSLKDVTIKGNNQTWTNNYGGLINFSGDVLMNGVSGDLNNVFYNYQTVNAAGNFQMNTGSTFYNYKDVNITGNFTVNGGRFENRGSWNVTGKIEVKNGVSSVYNYCKMIAKGGIINSSDNFYNYSYIWAQNDLGTGDITNTGTITNIVNYGFTTKSIPIIHGRNFTQTDGSIVGTVQMYFYGTTKATGGVVGATGATTDTIKMFDSTRTVPANIFDQQGATIYPNTIYNRWGLPDSTRIWMLGCSLEILLDIPLAIRWDYFYVTLTNEIPVLKWSAEFDEGTHFQVERSYDGKDFNAIKTVPTEKFRSEYSFDDNTVDKTRFYAYYRVKAVEPNGNEKYSQTRVVRFDSKPGKMKIAPNPFTTNFIIDYNAPVKENIIIRIFNTNGQQKLIKNVPVDIGSNRIDINEAANFASGVYIVQVSYGSSIISSGKIIKQ